jgi:DNA polymerase-3 subunit epsilon
MLDAAVPGSAAVPLPGDVMRALRLDRPLVIFDTETTGTDPKLDRIVEFAAVKLHPDGRRETMRTLVDPKVPIPPEASRIHGITDETVRGAPTLVETAVDILKFFDGADLVGYNIQRFDIPILQTELGRIGMELPLEGVRVVDPQVIFFNREPRDLQAAVRFYCGRELEGAHGALVDSEAALEVLEAQLVRYPDLPTDVAGLAERSTAAGDERYVDADRRFIWRHGEACFNFSKMRGRSLREVNESKEDRGILQWILNKDFSAEVKEIVREAQKGNYPVPPSTPQGEDA